MNAHSHFKWLQTCHTACPQLRVYMSLVLHFLHRENSLCAASVQSHSARHYIVFHYHLLASGTMLSVLREKFIERNLWKRHVALPVILCRELVVTLFCLVFNQLSS